MSFKVKFWGVRGSIATPSSRHIAYGGNTSCIEVAMGGERVILDAGTGIRAMGHHLTRKGIRKAHLLLSHSHWDHINGFPFFSPAFNRQGNFHILAGHLADHGGVREVFCTQMAQPTFPVPLEEMRAKLSFADFHAGETFALTRRIRVKTAPLNHPGGATGYRLEFGGKALCYVTDTEHVPDQPDQNILGLIEGADALIYDSTYTDAEFPAKRGWGHSTWQEGLRLARAAKVGLLFIFHHDPDHEDPFMTEVEAEARALWPGAIVARENQRLTLI